MPLDYFVTLSLECHWHRTSGKQIVAETDKISDLLHAVYHDFLLNSFIVVMNGEMARHV